MPLQSISKRFGLQKACCTQAYANHLQEPKVVANPGSAWSVFKWIVIISFNGAGNMMIISVFTSSKHSSHHISYKQEKDYSKSVTEMLELCHPNVVLVEKTVSRDIQESILAKRMTLVFDMKLHRLERIARCTGSPILSSDTMTSQKLKQCDSFHIEKFIEEHAGLGGKMPSKTLMFIEGSPTRLGCTVSLFPPILDLCMPQLYMWPHTSHTDRHIFQLMRLFFG